MVTQLARSTNWKSAVLGSNSSHSTTDSTKSISEVHSAIQRAFCATTASSPRAIRMNAVPTSGTKVTSERSGQWLICASRRSPWEQIPRHNCDEADHHRKRIVIEIPRLQPTGLAREIAGDRGDAIRTEAVDYSAVAGSPKTITE